MNEVIHLDLDHRIGIGNTKKRPFTPKSMPPTNVCPCLPLPLTAPDTDGTTVSYPAASNVYHYHFSSTGPYTLGCYGPDNKASDKLVTLNSCTSLYSACSCPSVNLCTSSGMASAYLWCPCYQVSEDTHRQAQAQLRTFISS